MELIPEGYDYMFLNIQQLVGEFKIHLCTEAEAKKWVSDYNEVTNKTMVYTHSTCGEEAQYTLTTLACS